MDYLQILLTQTEVSSLVVLFLFGIAAFALSTISGGGGALMLLPLLNWTIGVQYTAPVLNLGTFIGRPARLIIFWKQIHWKVCFYYAPAAIAGAWMGAWLFGRFRVEWLQILVGFFLISTLWQFRFGKKAKSFEVMHWHFIPIGFVVSILGTIIGAMGPVLNPFYLNLGLDKEDLIATKTANSFLMGIAQLGGYAFFGSLYGHYWIFGLSLGAGAIVGNVVGKQLLSQMKSTTFRRLVVAMMVISGCVLIYGQLKQMV